MTEVTVRLPSQGPTVPDIVGPAVVVVTSSKRPPRLDMRAGLSFPDTPLHPILDLPCRPVDGRRPTEKKAEGRHAASVVNASSDQTCPFLGVAGGLLERPPPVETS